VLGKLPIVTIRFYHFLCRCGYRIITSAYWGVQSLLCCVLFFTRVILGTKSLCEETFLKRFVLIEFSRLWFKQDRQPVYIIQVSNTELHYTGFRNHELCIFRCRIVWGESAVRSVYNIVDVVCCLLWRV
jgi:hypothetical protein